MDRDSFADIVELSSEQAALLRDLIEGEGLALDDGQAVIPRVASKKAPLSLTQHGLWFLDRWQPGTPLYNLPLAIRLEGPLNTPALEKALSAMVTRHEALRTTFPTENGEPIQQIHDPEPVALRVTALAWTPQFSHEPGSIPPGDTAQAERSLEEESRRPFDLARGPLFRACLQHRREDEHVLLLVMHHIIADAWSLDLLFDELAALYEGFAQEKTSPLPPLFIQYADFALWQREALTKEKLKKQFAYWKRQLANAPGGLNLPNDHPRPAAPTFHGAVQSLVLPRELTDGLRAICHCHQVTPFMALLGGFQILLHRYSGQNDLVIGTPVSHRSRIEMERMVGFFVNTVALRANLSGNPTFLQILERVREIVLGATAHQDVPFQRLIEELQMEREGQQHPLYQVMFSFERDSKQPRRAGTMTMTPLDLHTGVAKFDLTLSITERAQDFCATFEYNTELFEGNTIKRMLNHYQTLLQSITANPKSRVSELEFLSESEKKFLLHDLNATRRQFERNQCVHELFEQQMEKTPDSVAAVFDGHALTYRQLNQRAAKLAQSLRERGISSGGLVGIFFERSLETLASLLGVLKAGGAYLPLDLRYPKERLAYMIADAEPVLVLTRRKWLAALPPSEAQIICIDDAHWPSDEAQGSATPAGPPSSIRGRRGSEALASESKTENRKSKMNHPDTSGLASAPAPETGSYPGWASSNPENLAYVIYTSGSTGRPKGVEVPHRAVVNFLNSVRQKPGLNSEDVFLAVTPLSFDIAALELFLPLIVGARVVIVRDDETADGVQLGNAIRDGDVTVMQATPATWHLLLRSRWTGHPKLKALCGGEALTEGLANELLKRCGSIWNLYGPTETTIWSTLTQVEPTSGAVSIGGPIANTQIYLLDRYGQPVPSGVAGELCIGGYGVARGYRRRPELTAAKFVPDPFGHDAGARLYRTGDLARYLPDGSLEFLGRMDHQVKIRGHRIELGEIESALLRHSAVSECVVAAPKDNSGDQRLVAYVAAKARGAATRKRLYEFLKKGLPSHMVPTAFIFLDRLPRTPNGKVDRKSLPTPKAADLVRPKRFVPPRTAAEKSVAAILASVLAVDQIGVHDSFFALGGHSLLATRVMSRINSTFQVNLPVRCLFEGPSVAELTLEVAKGQSGRRVQATTISKRNTRRRTSQLLARIHQLSDAEVEVLLARELQADPERLP